MMKSLHLFLTIVMILFLIGCDKSDETTLIVPEETLTYSLNELIELIGENTGDDFQLIGGLWSQYWAQKNTCSFYRKIESYQIEEYNFTSYSGTREWDDILYLIIPQINANIENSVSNKNWDQLIINTVLKAYNYQLLVDLYNEVPYFEVSNRIENEKKYYIYNKGEIIYRDLINKLDSALLIRGKTNSNFSTIKKDILFNGDIDKWIQFANTLKLRMLLGMSYFDEEYARTSITRMSQENTCFLNFDAKIDNYISWNNNPNPLYNEDRVCISTENNLAISTTLFEYYRQNTDPRVNYIIDPKVNKTDSIKLSMPQGGFNIDAYKILPGNDVMVFRLLANDPVYLISEVESYLLQAEAIERGWCSGNAKELYDLAISTDFKRKGLAEKEEVLIGENGVYEYPINGTFEEKLKAIIMAKWAALAGTQGAEAFFETNRTGYPEISPVSCWVNDSYNPDYIGGKLVYSIEGVTGGVFPKRLTYPSREEENNPFFPGQTNVTDKVWWDVR